MKEREVVIILRS